MSKKGFTLVEIMIVVAIIALLAAISIPNLMRARLAANETAAIASIKTLITAMESWRATHWNFDGVTLPVLANPPDASPPYIDRQLGSGWMSQKQGYWFYLWPLWGAPPSGSQRYLIYAFPQQWRTTGNRWFLYINYSLGGGWQGGSIYTWSFESGGGWRLLE